MRRLNLPHLKRGRLARWMRQGFVVTAALTGSWAVAQAQNDACTITSIGVINFGSYYWISPDPLVLDITPFTYACTNLSGSRTLTMSLDMADIESTVTTTRRLYQVGAPSAPPLLYTLRLPGVNGKPWGSGTEVTDLTSVFRASLGAGSPNGLVSLTLSIPAGQQLLGGGSYFDTLTVTITVN